MLTGGHSLHEVIFGSQSATTSISTPRGSSSTHLPFRHTHCCTIVRKNMSFDFRPKLTCRFARRQPFPSSRAERRSHGDARPHPSQAVRKIPSAACASSPWRRGFPMYACSAQAAHCSQQPSVGYEPDMLTPTPRQTAKKMDSLGSCPP